MCRPCWVHVREERCVTCCRAADAPLFRLFTITPVSPMSWRDDGPSGWDGFVSSGTWPGDSRDHG